MFYWRNSTKRLILYANIKGPFNYSSSLIHIAVYYGNLVQHLLNKGVNIDLVDKNGNTAAYIAVMRDNIEIFKILLNKGANIDIKNNNGTSV
ncbi:MAG: ankyrin repeat domain-containing protein [Candidatus Tisiphia sp.]